MKKKRHLQRRKRVRPVLVDADMWVWVYWSTVYSTEGTTWSGSLLWKGMQQEVWQHWFIDSYIAAYIQGLYRAVRVHPTGLTINQGCRQISTTSPKSLLNKNKLIIITPKPKKLLSRCHHVVTSPCQRKDPRMSLSWSLTHLPLSQSHTVGTLHLHRLCERHFQFCADSAVVNLSPCCEPNGAIS
jgi:hypothetical protein